MLGLKAYFSVYVWRKTWPGSAGLVPCHDPQHYLDQAEMESQHTLCSVLPSRGAATTDLEMAVAEKVGKVAVRCRWCRLLVVGFGMPTKSDF